MPPLFSDYHNQPGAGQREINSRIQGGQLHKDDTSIENMMAASKIPTIFGPHSRSQINKNPEDTKYRISSNQTKVIDGKTTKRRLSLKVKKPRINVACHMKYFS